MPLTNEEYGAKRELHVAAWRKARRIKQTDLAVAAKVSVQALSAIERGRSFPHVRTLARIRTALGLETVEDLYRAPPASQRHQLRRDQIEDLERAARIIRNVAEVAARTPERMPLVMDALRRTREQPRNRRTGGK